MNGEDKKNSSEVTLNVFISILTLVLLFLTSFKDGKLVFNQEGQKMQMFYVFLSAIALAIIVNWKKVNTYVNRLKSKISFFFNIVIKYRHGHLEFLDRYGVKAMYYEECLFNKIVKNEIYSSNILVDGKIGNEVHTYNCYNSLNNKKNKITITYGKKKQNLDIVHNKRQLQFGFVVTMLNTFPKKDEFWDTVFNHYTKIYDLKLSFHKDNPPRDVDIFQVTYDEEGNEHLFSLPVDPLIMHKYERIIMKVKLLHLNKGDRLRVSWNWDKPKTKKKKNKSKKKKK